MEKYVVAIPSYKRASQQITAEYFAGLGMPRDRIFIFVQTAEDLKEYKKNEQIATIKMAPANGVAKARNNILNSLVSFTNVLMLDDDVQSIGRLIKGETVPIQSREEMAQTINKCFAQAKGIGAPLFGIYPIDNAFFMSKSISKKVTVNTVLGFQRGFKERFDETYIAKEDLELCARIISEGKPVMRFNFLAVNAKHRTNAGGCFNVWKSAEHKKTVERLCKAYPDFFAPKGNNPNEVRVIAKDDKIQLGRKD